MTGGAQRSRTLERGARSWRAARVRGRQWWRERGGGRGAALDTVSAESGYDSDDWREGREGGREGGKGGREGWCEGVH